ncbi:hypothetical protein [Mycobacterium neglectum]|uniref:hypothetical protein n=1 Tax=Mycobacterium neglectum TaxID=242737 RepID=UPI000BFEE69A|nr:hypothetical protein [Mycobacterium neglectum]
MHRLTVRSALAAMAVAAAALGTAGIAGAAPSGPCEEVTYVGVCQPFHQQPQTRSPSQQGMGEVIVPGIGNNPVVVG